MYFPKNRNRFMNNKELNGSLNIENVDSNEIIKFIGRQHGVLTDIMDQLNFCYSLQVKRFLFNFMPNWI